MARIDTFIYISKLLQRLFSLTGDTSVLDESVETLGLCLIILESMDVTDDGGDRLSKTLLSLSLAFKLRHQHCHDVSDLDSTIQHLRRAIAVLEEQGDPAGQWRSELALALVRRFEWRHTPDDLEEAIEMQELSILLQADDHHQTHHHSRNLKNLGYCLMTRFEYASNMKDLEHGLASLKEALAISSPEDPSFTSILHNLAGALTRHFQVFGQLSDIHEAISAYRKALCHGPPDNSAIFLFFSNFSLSLRMLYDRTQDIHVLMECIQRARDAVSLSPSNHPSLPSALNTQATNLVALADHQNDPKYAQEALEYYKRAIGLTSSRSSLHSMILDNLGYCHQVISKGTSNITHLDKAIESHSEALRLGSPNEPQRYTVMLMKLGNALRTRYQSTRVMKDIDESIEVLHQARDLIPSNHPWHPIYSESLARSYQARSSSYQVMGDHQRAIDLFTQAARSNVASPELRISAAQAWATLASSAFDLEQTILALDTGIKLISLVGGLEQTVEERFEAVSKQSLFITTSIALAIGAGRLDQSIEWLEQGRGLVWGQISSLRTSINAIESVDPVLAREFEDVCRSIEVAAARQRTTMYPIPSVEKSMSIQDQATTHIHLTEKREFLLSRIRTEIPGFEHYLKPLPASTIYDRLPANGIVVALNVGPAGCQAVALQRDKEPLPIWLDNISYDDAMGLADRLKGTLMDSGLLSKDKPHWRGWNAPSGDRGIRRRATPTARVSEIETILHQLWVKMVKPILNALYLQVCLDHSHHR